MIGCMIRPNLHLGCWLPSPLVISSSRQGCCRPIYMATPSRISKFGRNFHSFRAWFWGTRRACSPSLLTTSLAHHRTCPWPLLLTSAPGWCLFLLTGMPAPAYHCARLVLVPPHWHARSCSPLRPAGACSFLTGVSAPAHHQTYSLLLLMAGAAYADAPRRPWQASTLLTRIAIRPITMPPSAKLRIRSDSSIEIWAYVSMYLLKSLLIILVYDQRILVTYTSILMILLHPWIGIQKWCSSPEIPI